VIWSTGVDYTSLQIDVLCLHPKAQDSTNVFLQEPSTFARKKVSDNLVRPTNKQS